MDFKGIVGLNLYSVIIIVVVYIYAINNMDTDSFQSKTYLWMLRVSILMLIVDVISRFDGNPNSINLYLNHIGNFLLFLFNPVLAALWIMYVLCNVYKDEEKSKNLLIPLIILFVINGFFVILTQFYGWFYYIDSGNIYHRGPFYLISALTSIVLVILSFYMIVKNRKKIEKGLFIPLMIFGLIPSIAILIQILNYGVSLMLAAVSVSLFIAFINIQIKTIHTDFLTGVGNRKKLEIILKEKIDSTSKHKSFSAIMVDLDDFKSINDSFGHHAGDEALKTTARLLNNCLRANDYISRFGGDEFYIVLDISDNSRLEALIDRIKSCFENYNQGSGLPFKLKLSMGYSIYDYDANMNVEEFQKHIDSLLYENKKLNKEI